MTWRPARNFIEFLKEQLAPLGHVTTRRMFSGAGIYCDGVIFALVLRDVVHFKVDDGNRAAYAAEGLQPFSYQAKGRTVQMGAYWRVPERLFDDPDEMVTGRAPRWRRGSGRRSRRSRTASAQDIGSAEIAAGSRSCRMRHHHAGRCPR